MIVVTAWKFQVGTFRSGHRSGQLETTWKWLGFRASDSKFAEPLSQANTLPLLLCVRVKKLAYNRPADYWLLIMFSFPRFGKFNSVRLNQSIEKTRESVCFFVFGELGKRSAGRGCKQSDPRQRQKASTAWVSPGYQWRNRSDEAHHTGDHLECCAASSAASSWEASPTARCESGVLQVARLESLAHRLPGVAGWLECRAK